MPKIIKRKKITRHELKEDRLLEATKNFIAFFQANTSRIILVVVILVGAAITARIFLSNRRNAEEMARVKMLYASSFYENGNFIEAVSSFQEILHLYGGTKTGRIASLFLANSYFYSGDMENALRQYEESLRLLRKNPNWASAAEMGIASVYEQKGSFDEAIGHYNNVIDNYKDTPVRIDALFSKARCLEFVNNFTEAIEVYSTIESGYPDTDFAGEAKRRIVFLRGATESERIPK